MMSCTISKESGIPTILLSRWTELMCLPPLSQKRSGPNLRKTRLPMYIPSMRGTLNRVSETFSAVTLAKEDASCLDVAAGTPALRIDRTSFAKIPYWNTT